MKKLIFAMIIVFNFACVANGSNVEQKGLDFSSKQSYEMSLRTVKSNLNEQQIKELDISILAIRMFYLDKGQANEVPKILQGKTAAEVVKIAKELE